MTIIEHHNINGQNNLLGKKQQRNIAEYKEVPYILVNSFVLHILRHKKKRITPKKETFFSIHKIAVDKIYFKNSNLDFKSI
jgi:hypothetical protein